MSDKELPVSDIASLLNDARHAAVVALDYPLAARLRDAEVSLRAPSAPSLTAAIKEKIGEWRETAREPWARETHYKDGRADALIECAAELEQLVSRQSDWRDIATAPKDGTILWGWLKLAGGPERYHQDTFAWFASKHHEGGGWWVSHALAVEPKFWMPLPASPVAQEGQDSE